LEIVAPVADVSAETRHGAQDWVGDFGENRGRQNEMALKPMRRTASELNGPCTAADSACRVFEKSVTFRARSKTDVHLNK
jgi:hypothetical protein